MYSMHIGAVRKSTGEDLFPLYHCSTYRAPTFLPLLSSLRNVQTTWNRHPFTVEIRASCKLQLGSQKVCVASRDLGLIFIGDLLCVRDSCSAACLHMSRERERERERERTRRAAAAKSLFFPSEITRVLTTESVANRQQRQCSTI
jgi:hypothetical protein